MTYKHDLWRDDAHMASSRMSKSIATWRSITTSADLYYIYIIHSTRLCIYYVRYDIARWALRDLWWANKCIHIVFTFTSLWHCRRQIMPEGIHRVAVRRWSARMLILKFEPTCWCNSIVHTIYTHVVLISLNGRKKICTKIFLDLFMHLKLNGAIWVGQVVVVCACWRHRQSGVNSSCLPMCAL